MAYKQYKHKLNLLEPGHKILRIIFCLGAVSLLTYLVRLTLISILFFICTALLTVFLILLVVYELHQDKVLNEQAIRLDPQFEKAIHNKSYAKKYKNQTMWYQHLDYLGDQKTSILEKFRNELPILGEQTSISFLVVNLEESYVDQEVLSTIVTAVLNLDKGIKKISFVGLSRGNRRLLKRIIRNLHRKPCLQMKCMMREDKAIAWCLTKAMTPE